MIHYLATPYTHVNPSIVDARVRETMRYAHALLSAGYTVFSPILHCHNMANNHDMPTDAKFWWEYNLAHLQAFKRVIVCEIDGWKMSTGVKMEIQWARDNDVPLMFCTLHDDGKIALRHAY